MKILSKKETRCTSIKIMIKKSDDKKEILNDYSREGFKVTKRICNYGQSTEFAINHSPEGDIYTLVKYEPLLKD